MKRFFAVLAVLVTIGASLFALNGRSTGASDSPRVTSASVYAVNSVTTRAPGKAVDFTWTDAAGRENTFSSVTAGKVVLLNVWATWCPPCRKEIPDLVKISDEMASKGVMVIGVSIDEKADAVTLVRTYAEKNNVTYLNLVDAQKEIAKSYGSIQAIPTTFIIDRQGSVVQRIVGSQSKEAFVAAIQKAM